MKGLDFQRRTAGSLHRISRAVKHEATKLSKETAAKDKAKTTGEKPKPPRRAQMLGLRGAS